MQSDRDARKICYEISCYSHADHPLRRVVLGPLPATSVSDQTLLHEAERCGILPTSESPDVPASPMSSAAPSILSRRRSSFMQRRSGRRRSLRPRLKRTQSTSSFSLNSLSPLPFASPSNLASIQEDPLDWVADQPSYDAHADQAEHADNAAMMTPKTPDPVTPPTIPPSLTPVSYTHLTLPTILLV